MTIIPSMADRIIYGMIFPAMISIGVSGVTRSCSIEPSSFSRVMASAVSMAEIIIRIMAIRPGTKNRELFCCGL